VANLVFWLFHASHVGHWGMDVAKLTSAMGWSIFRSALTAILFLGLEPFIRRYCGDGGLGLLHGDAPAVCRAGGCALTTGAVGRGLQLIRCDG
jgi:hypothetical protein